MDNKQAYPPAYAVSDPSAPAPQAVIVTQPATVTTAYEQKPSATGSIVLSCFVFWCCCWPLGLVSFIFAMLASSANTAAEAAEKIGISKKVSIAGLVCGVIFIIIFIIVQVVAAANTTTTTYDNGY